MRCLIVSASMGAGHDGVARELAGRLTDTGQDAHVVDLLDLLPLRSGAVLRRLYSGMVRHAPWLYEVVYRLFFVSRSGRQPSASPVVLLALPRLRSAVQRHRPDVVVSTFHLAAQATGRLRQRGELTAPTAVVLVDFAVHRLWLHPGNDLYLCSHPGAAAAVRATLGVPARSTGPVVPWPFHACRRSGADPAAAHRTATRRRLGLPEQGSLVVLAGGSLGMGSGVRSAATAIAGSGRYVPVVLCGRNDRLRRELSRTGGVVALGWLDDVPALFGTASALVENGGGGLTCAEAFAAGLPVVTYRPIPGHGRAGAGELAAAGLSVLAHAETELLFALDRVTGPEGQRQARRARSLFTEDPASAVVELAATAAGPGATMASRSDRPVGSRPVVREV